MRNNVIDQMTTHFTNSCSTSPNNEIIGGSNPPVNQHNPSLKLTTTITTKPPTGKLNPISTSTKDQTPKEYNDLVIWYSNTPNDDNEEDELSLTRYNSQRN